MKLLLILLTLTFSGCMTKNLNIIEDPDGNMVYQLPESRDAKDHCDSVKSFAIKEASGRSFFFYKDDDKKVEVKNNLEDAQADLTASLRNVDKFTPRGKRNYNKMLSVLKQIYDRKDLLDKSPEQVGEIIYHECIIKMNDKTWFND
jgi:hypothetical protein